MKKIALLLAGFAFSQMAVAQISITSTASPYTQNFNTLDTASATVSTNLPTGWMIKENGTSGPALDGGYKGGNGSSNTGDTYSFGSIGSTDRAIGSLASGTNRPNFGVRFTNNTGSTITSISVTYRAEEWRSGPSTAGDTTRFYYNLTATGVDTFVTGDVEVASLTMTSVVPAQAAGAVDGNAAGNFTTKTGTITVNIPNGSSILFKWVDWNAFGSDEGLAVDDFSATFNAGPPVPNPILVGKTPADDAVGVAPGTNLVLTFDKVVTANAAGNITIKNVTDNTTQTKAGNSSDVVISGGGMIVTVNNVTLVANKNYYVNFDSATFTSGVYKAAGIYDATSWNFSVSNVGVINTVKNELGLSVIGTATNSNMNIMFSLAEAGSYNLSIMDLSGRQMHTETFNAGAGTQIRSINGLSLASGMYIIRLSNESGVGVTKAIVQ